MVNKILERNDINWQYDLTIHISADLDSRGSFLTKFQSIAGKVLLGYRLKKTGRGNWPRKPSVDSEK